ncbi:hypothetical protein [Dysgonomonas sp. ZJ709]|uniref:hypothetical protein n=1 Tax=Dysgonomonas sp. ZJ709 TaxID=2709797 RepID=UPI0013EC58A5|nr:hypothetical protein [Dysgonomonas sp. ZJ709]
MKFLEKGFLSIFLLLSVANSHAQTTDTLQAGYRVIQNQSDTLENYIKKSGNFKISGYFQGQYIYAERDAPVKIGSANENTKGSFSRIGIRRSRLKVTYEEGIGSGTFQIDMSERGIVVRDAFLSLKDPWLKTGAFQAGIYLRPFGYEVRHSSSRRETPERARIFTTLFPNERDLGFGVQLRTKESSPLSFLLLEASLVAGNGVMPEIDSKRDLITRLSAFPRFGKHITVNAGISYYKGSVYQGTENVYRMTGNGFVVNNNSGNSGSYAKREYYGFDIQMAYNLGIGRSQIRFEYLFGQQPATLLSSGSPNKAVRPAEDTYIRNFTGGSFIVVQDIGKLPISIFSRIDWYDPNNQVEGNNIGLNGTSKTDIAYKTFGIGTLWKYNRDLELNVYYEWIRNETSLNLLEYKDDRKDNVFTFSILYRY